MTALDLAGQGLRNGDSSLVSPHAKAVAFLLLLIVRLIEEVIAGCNWIYDLQTMSLLINMKFLSPDNGYHSFNHNANGMAVERALAE